MSLLDNNMLPAQVRTMKPMDDLLQAEQIMLEIIEGIIMDLMSDALLARAVTITPDYLTEVITGIFKLDCTIMAYPEELTIKIWLHDTGQELENPTSQIKKSNRFIPAHLKVLYEYVSKHLLTGRIYVATPRTDYIELSVPAVPMNSFVHREVYLGLAAPLLQYIEVAYPTERTGESI